MSDFVDYTESSTTGEIEDLSDYYTKSQTSTLVTTRIDDHAERHEIENCFKNAYSVSYTESVETNGKITQINIYVDDTKVIKLFTKDFVRSGNFVTSVSIKDEIANNTLVKNFTYVNGRWFSTAKTFIRG